MQPSCNGHVTVVVSKSAWEALNSVWQRVAACDRVWQHVAACDSVWQRVAACDSVWQRAAACDSVWQRVAACDTMRNSESNSMRQLVTVCIIAGVTACMPARNTT